MKVITLFATLIITILSCNCQKKATENKIVLTNVNSESKMQNEIPIIYYETTTRGFFTAMKIENQMLFSTKERGFTEYSERKSISDSDWKIISNLAKAVNLEKVKDYKGITEKRFVDAAPQGNVVFELNNVKYASGDFDHGFPPKEIEILINQIVKIAQTK